MSSKNDHVDTKELISNDKLNILPEKEKEIEDSEPKKFLWYSKQIESRPCILLLIVWLFVILCIIYFALYDIISINFFYNFAIFINL